MAESSPTLWQKIVDIQPPYTVSRIAYRLNIAPAQVVRVLRQRMKILGYKTNRNLALHLAMRKDTLQVLERKSSSSDRDAEIQRLMTEIQELTVLDCLNRDLAKSNAETNLPLFSGRLEAPI
jgi:hypothetical protein